MKLIFVNIGKTIRIATDTSPVLRCSQDAMTCYSVSFTLAEPLNLENGTELTGDIIWSSLDNFVLRTFRVKDFLRYEYTENEDGTYTLLLTTEEKEKPSIGDTTDDTEKIILAKENAKARIIEARNESIASGIDIDTEYGVEHFTLNDSDKTLLLGIYGMVQSGATAFPYHSVGLENTTNICTVYSDADISKIAVAAFAYITFHEAYANMLVQWIEREEDPDVVENQIVYGADLPNDLFAYFGMVLSSAIVNGKVVSLPLNLPGYVYELLTSIEIPKEDPPRSIEDDVNDFNALYGTEFTIGQYIDLINETNTFNVRSHLRSEDCYTTTSYYQHILDSQTECDEMCARVGIDPSNQSDVYAPIPVSLYVVLMNRHEGYNRIAETANASIDFDEYVRHISCHMYSAKAAEMYPEDYVEKLLHAAIYNEAHGTSYVPTEIDTILFRENAINFYNTIHGTEYTQETYLDLEEILVHETAIFNAENRTNYSIIDYVALELHVQFEDAVAKSLIEDESI